MISFDELLKLLQGGSRNGSNAKPGAGSGGAPQTATGQAAAAQAAATALASKQADEAYLAIRQLGANGEVLQHSEELTHGQGGLKAITKEVRMLTCTGELVEPKQIRVVCSHCSGLDSVVAHCRCGAGICRRCARRDPADGVVLCPVCYQRALESFNTWR